ncbi:hypothetical protein [Rothia mucilaginosa]|uniref:hypothetical protein n=1 Tax=Rothia mucilaginosa TaxID=43675 RepID=UPI0028EF92A3|nr:hypothetical protein [Rothia mucilaginosa]
MAEDKVVFDRLVVADEHGHLQGKPAEGVQQQIEQALAPLEKIPAGGANGEVLARANGDGTQLAWRTVRDGVDGQPGRDGTDGAPGRDGLDGRGISRIEPTAGGSAVNVVMSDGSATEVPVNVTSNWSLEAQAKAQGYVVVTGDTPPAEDTMFGVPVYWMKGAGTGAAIPVQAPMPSTNFIKRIITIPDRVGVKYTVDGSPVPAGDYVVPGTVRKTVEIMAHAANENYVLPGTYRWMRTFGSFADRPLVASDVFTGRAAGEVLVPPATAEGKGKFIQRRRPGAAWNNAAGGSLPVSWGQSGDGVSTIDGVEKPSSWVVTENGTILNSDWRMEGAITFQSITPNISVEVDIAAVRKPSSFSLEVGQQREFNSSKGRTGEISLTPAGFTIGDRAPDGRWGAPLNGGAPVGTWRFDFLDGIMTITSPSGIQVVQTAGEMQPSDYGQFSKIWTGSREAVEISAIRMYRHPAE